MIYMSIKGVIIKGVGGLYTVKTARSLIACSPRGVFRKTGQTLLAGDYVEIVKIDDEVNRDDSYRIENVLPRKNQLLRPPVANVDQLVIVASICEPNFNPQLVDIMTVLAEYNDMEPIVVITKTDLMTAQKWREVYESAGFKCICTDNVHENIVELERILNGKISAFSGNSGVGKTTLLNALAPGLNEKTGEISDKLGRGRHTTRVSEIFDIGDDTYIIDTPGFSSVDINVVQPMECAELQHCFPDFEEYIFNCKFNNCVHVGEIGCAVKAAVEAGKIAESRYGSYLNFYKSLNERVLW